MNKVLEKLLAIFNDIKKDPGAYLSLFIMIALVGGAIYVFVFSGNQAEMFRELYCQNNPLQCIRKGW